MTDNLHTEMPFVRPSDSATRRFVNRRLLPSAPESQVAYDFGSLKTYSSFRITLLGIGIEFAHFAVSIGLIQLWRGFAIAPFVIIVGGTTWLTAQSPRLMLALVLLLIVLLCGILVWQFARNSGAEWKHLKTSVRSWFRDERDRLRQHRANRQAVRKAGGDKSVRVPVKHKVRGLTRIVIAREQWLRQGSEGWTKKQRVVACMASSICVIPIALTSISEFTAHVLFAGLYMKLYLRAYRQYGNQREAVLRTVLIHRAVNRAIVLVLLLNGFIAYVNFDLFMSIHGH